MEISMNHLKTYVFDRYEGPYAVLVDEKGGTYDVLHDELPAGIIEGDVLHENGGAYIVDEALTEKKREKMQRLFEELSHTNSK